MIGTIWLAYFEGNARRDCVAAPSLCREVPPILRAPLSLSLGRFQLGEAAGGKLHDDMPTHPDPVLDAAMRRAVQLYIEEEWRHARELASIILGGELQTAHWTNGAFTACRRLLGLRWLLRSIMFAILAAALLVLLLDHGRVLREVRASAHGIVSASWRELASRRFLQPELPAPTEHGLVRRLPEAAPSTAAPPLA